MLAYLRRNAIALLALFVALGGTGAYAANTVFSADIVDGEVKTADLANLGVTSAKLNTSSVSNAKLAPSAVGTGKVLDNNLTGADVNESTFARVPDAAAVDGVPSDGFRHYGWTARQATSSCSVSQTWKECATYTLTVPADHHYVVTITSTINANPGNITGAQVLACPATDGPTCTRSEPERADFPANRFTSWTTSTTNDFFSGTYRFNTAMKWNLNVPASTEGQTTTTVQIYDFWMEHIG